MPYPGNFRLKVRLREEKKKMVEEKKTRLYEGKTSPQVHFPNPSKGRTEKRKGPLPLGAFSHSERGKKKNDKELKYRLREKLEPSSNTCCSKVNPKGESKHEGQSYADFWPRLKYRIQRGEQIESGSTRRDFYPEERTDPTQFRKSLELQSANNSPNWPQGSRSDRPCEGGKLGYEKTWIGSRQKKNSPLTVLSPP